MLFRSIHVVGSRILVLGLTFKEDCHDLRNTRVVDIVRELRDTNAQVDVYDPWANVDEAERELSIRPVTQPEAGAYDAVVLAVGHAQFVAPGFDMRMWSKPNSVLYDVRGILARELVDARL